MIHSGVLFVARANFQQFNLYISYNDRVKMVLCVRHGHQLFGVSYHFKIFRSQVAIGKKLILRPGFILFGALVAPVYFQLEPLLLWFYFIWGPCCSCLF